MNVSRAEIFFPPIDPASAQLSLSPAQPGEVCVAQPPLLSTKSNWKILALVALREGAHR